MPNLESHRQYEREKKAAREEREYEEVRRLKRDRDLRARELPAISKAQKKRCKGFFTCEDVEDGEPESLCPWGKRKVPIGAQQLDHIIRVADGGSDDPENLQMLCACCHAMKTAFENGAVITGRDTPPPPPPPPPRLFAAGACSGTFLIRAI